MKILLTVNKTYRGRPDTGHWYVYSPLIELGHEVYWYDTVDPVERDYNKVIEQLKPDLIFCCMTNNKGIAPYEPWDAVKEETESGRTRTFNWFCDDTWRFENFSSKACHYFNICSTPEPLYLERFRMVGYNNILLGSWHANSDFYPEVKFSEKENDLSFIGYLTPDRKSFLDECGLPVRSLYGLSNEEMFCAHAQSKIGLNLSRNDNDPFKGTQMKQRMFEIPAGGGLLVTEYHEGIEQFFEIDKEIATFRTPEELSEKVKILLNNPRLVEDMAAAGHKRFLKEHESKVRLANLLEQIRRL